MCTAVCFPLCVTALDDSIPMCGAYYRGLRCAACRKPTWVSCKPQAYCAASIVLFTVSCRQYEAETATWPHWSKFYTVALPHVPVAGTTVTCPQT